MTPRQPTQLDSQTPSAHFAAPMQRLVAAQRRVRLALASAALLALSACASLQQPAEAPLPEPTPALWTAASAGGPASDLSVWWVRFGDPALPPLVEQALLFNTNVTVAKSRLRQARAQRMLAEANLAPNLTGSGSAQSNRAEGRAASEQYRASLDAAWELDLWGASAAGCQRHWRCP